MLPDTGNPFVYKARSYFGALHRKLDAGELIEVRCKAPHHGRMRQTFVPSAEEAARFAVSMA